jgi:5-methylcytosine-specific restriction endonuclease McrA
VRGGGHKDLAATAAAKFTDPRSYVRLDGKQFLFGRDIEKLRLRVFIRDGYRCTGEVDGERCNRPVTWDGGSEGHMHHIKSRGKAGDDSLQNCVTLCARCHAKEHVRPLLKWIRETA